MFKTNLICGETTTVSCKEYNPAVLLMEQKLNKYLSRQNEILFIRYNDMFRPISGHPQVHVWPLNHIEEEIYIT
jgi:hypothetical protein